MFFSIAAHHHHRHPFKKITHPSFPKGGYILVQYPLAHRILSTNNNQLDENSLSNELLSNDISNDAYISHDISNNVSVNKHRHSVKSKRYADPININYCCSDERTCAKHNCH